MKPFLQYQQDLFCLIPTLVIMDAFSEETGDPANIYMATWLGLSLGIIHT